MELSTLPLRDIVDAIRRKVVSQKEVYDYFLGRIDRIEPSIHACNHVHRDFVEQPLDSILAGIPLGVKDNYCTKGMPSTASSRMLETFIPPYDSTAIRYLKDAGATLIAKTNCDEFALGSTGENSAFGVTKNPWDMTRVPGGTSSGSAAGVLAGLFPAALGTDTGGSIRQPSSLCGVVGFKPTYGRISRYGVIAAASSLDTLGVITRDVRDAGFLYSLMAGHDPLDATSLSDDTTLPEDTWTRSDLRGIRVGVPREYFGDGMEEGVRATILASIETMRRLGAEIVDISLPMSEHGVSVYYIVNCAEVSTNLARYDGIRYGHAHEGGMDIARNRAEGFGAEAKRRILLGSFVLSSGFYDAYYRRAALVRERIREDFREAFTQVDVIVGPVSPSVAWKIGAKIDDPLAMYLADIFTVTPSLAGIPGLSLPVGYAAAPDDGTMLPVGLHILGPRLGEAKVLSVAHVLEQALADTVRARRPSLGE